MCDTVREFWTELKILAYFAFPLLHLCCRGYLIVSRVQLDTVEQPGVMLQEIFFFGTLRVKLADPVFTSPFGAAYVEFRFAAALAFFQYSGRLRRIGRQRKIYMLQFCFGHFAKFHAVVV